MQGTRVRSLVRELRSHMRGGGQLSPCATTTELCAPQRESPCAANYRAPAPWSPCATTRERKKNPHATTREKPTRHNKRSLMPQLRPDTAKNKIKKINKYFLKKERKSVPANVPVKTGLDSWEPIV